MSNKVGITKQMGLHVPFKKFLDFELEYRHLFDIQLRKSMLKRGLVLKFMILFCKGGII